MKSFEYEQEPIVQDEEDTLIDEEDYIYDGNCMYDISDYYFQICHQLFL